MSQMYKVAKYLSTRTKGAAVTASMIAKGTGVPRMSVMKRIHDLRNEGVNIVADHRTVGGKRKVYYSYAA